MLGEKGGCPRIRQLSAFGVPTIAHFRSKAMVKTVIAMQRYLVVIAKAGMNCGLRFGSDKMVGGGNMQHQRIGDSMAFVQHLVDHYPIIANRRGDVGSRGCHISEPSA